MIPNQDEHGIRFTMYSMNDIDAELADSLLYQHGKDLSYEDACKEEEKAQRAAWEAMVKDGAPEDYEFPEFELDLDDFQPMIDEPIIEGCYQGVHYRTTWMQGQMLWVFKSPIVGHFRLCSPCVPGACDGGSPTPRADGFLGYAVPPDWLYVDPESPRESIDWMGEFE